MSSSSTGTKRYLFLSSPANATSLVVLQRGDEMPSLTRDEIEVFRCGKPAIHQHESEFQLVAKTHVAIISRINSFFVTTLLRLSWLVLVSRYSIGFFSNSNATGNDLPLQ
jgi:hypothetical protein